MPLLISEIGVRIAVRDPDGAPAASTAPHATAALSPADRSAIVADAVAVVLRTLRLRAER